MTTRDTPATGACALSCAACGGGITHDVVRVDEGRVYHLACFRRVVFEPGTGLYECPRCLTLGSYRTGRGMTECLLCGGLGYLAVAEGGSDA
jgi:hypothetical protein